MKHRLLFLLLSLLPLLPSAAQSQMEAYSIMARGHAYYNQKAYAQAMAEYQKTVRYNLNNSRMASVYNRMGYMYNHGLGVVQNTQTAKAYYTRAARMGNQQARKNLEAMQINAQIRASRLQAQQQRARQAATPRQQTTYRPTQTTQQPRQSYSTNVQLPRTTYRSSDPLDQHYYDAMREQTMNSINMEVNRYPQNSHVTNVAPLHNIVLDANGNLMMDSYGGTYSRHDGGSTTRPAKSINKSQFNRNQNAESRAYSSAKRNPSGSSMSKYHTYHNNNQTRYGR